MAVSSLGTLTLISCSRRNDQPIQNYYYIVALDRGLPEFLQLHNDSNVLFREVHVVQDKRHHCVLPLSEKADVIHLNS